MTAAHASLLADVTLVGLALGMEETEFERLRRLGRYHDLGKVAIPMEILNKRELLSPSEWKEIRKHAEIGGRIAQQMPDLMDLAEAIRHHHECWDGSGYPNHIAGEKIPLLSRILAVADAYDAMTEDRVYRKALTHEVAMGESRKNAGTQFDPQIAEVFLEIIERDDL